SKEIPNLYLLMVNAPESILQQAEKSNYRNKIIIVPKILGDQKLAIAYSAMNVMVHIAEQGESFGLVLPEAILCGTPVITMSTPWGDNSQCEVVGHKEGGFVVHTKKGVKKAIHEIIKRSRSKNLKFHDKIVEEKYAHVRVAEKALEGIQKIDEHPDLKMNAIHKILRNSFDRPSLITVFLIRLNLDKLRRLTSYSSGYRDLSMLIPTLLRLVGVRAK
ncbi:MAG: glycosyltransferase, partial [Bacteroidota bacterium]